MSSATVGAARRLAAPVYSPWFGMSMCVGMVAVALPLYLEDIDVGYLALSAVLAAVGLGSAVGGIPAGDRVSRFGPSRIILIGAVTIAVTTLLVGFSRDALVLIALQFLAGVGAIAMRIGGQTWITVTAPASQRGRLLSTLGGIRRFGMFAGPFVAGVCIQAFGFTTTFVVAGVLAVIGLAPNLGVTDPGPGPAPERVSLLSVLATHWRRLLIAASGPVLIMVARRGRSIVLPLIGVELSLSPAEVGLLVSVGAGADLLLFPVAGYLMDRFGRLKAIVPAFCLMAAGLFLLAAADSGTAVVIAGSVIGVGNGLSAGTMLTLGSDLAPEESTSQFLAGFAALQDWGQILGPLLVGWIAAAIGLGASAAALGVVLLVGVGLIVVTVGETGGGRAGSVAQSPAS
ncbi:MAG: MFS transporter [Actinomycetota bacterium]